MLAYSLPQTYLGLVSARSEGLGQADSQSTYFIPCETQAACRLQRWDAYLASLYLSPCLCSEMLLPRDGGQEREVVIDHYRVLHILPGIS